MSRDRVPGIVLVLLFALTFIALSFAQKVTPQNAYGIKSLKCGEGIITLYGHM